MPLISVAIGPIVTSRASVGKLVSNPTRQPAAWLTPVGVVAVVWKCRELDGADARGTAASSSWHGPRRHRAASRGCLARRTSGMSQPRPPLSVQPSPRDKHRRTGQDAGLASDRHAQMASRQVHLGFADITALHIQRRC